MKNQIRMDEEEIEKKVTEIVSWADEPTVPSIESIIKRLDDLGFEVKY